jgi:acetyl-CoA carboxylase biotin carboxyl carrier protein
MTERPADTEIGEVLEAVRRSLLSVLESLPDQPQRLRVHASDVTIELEWPRPPDVIHATAIGPLEASTAAVPARAVTSGALTAHGPNGAAYRGRDAAPDGAAPPADPAQTTHQVCAPSVGVFYRAPEPGAKPFVNEGDVIRPGQQVAIIEAMKLMLPVEAQRPGRVLEVLKADGAPVEYGEPLFVLARVESE